MAGLVGFFQGWGAGGADMNTRKHQMIGLEPAAIICQQAVIVKR